MFSFSWCMFLYCQLGVVVMPSEVCDLVSLAVAVIHTAAVISMPSPVIHTTTDCSLLKWLRLNYNAELSAENNLCWDLVTLSNHLSFLLMMLTKQRTLWNLIFALFLNLLTRNLPPQLNVPSNVTKDTNIVCSYATGRGEFTALRLPSCFWGTATSSWQHHWSSSSWIHCISTITVLLGRIFF